MTLHLPPPSPVIQDPVLTPCVCAGSAESHAAVASELSGVRDRRQGSGDRVMVSQRSDNVSETRRLARGDTATHTTVETVWCGCAESGDTRVRLGSHVWTHQHLYTLIRT